MRILITGANGFIAKNLRVRLREAGHQDVICLTRESTQADLESAAADTDFVFHLAGVNRAADDQAFHEGNTGYTARLCAALSANPRKPSIAYASSTQATRDSIYGRSKLGAEREIEGYSRDSGAKSWIYRLTNVFGKWCRPNYNSAVATFCHSIARGLPIRVDDASLALLYVDDVIDDFIRLLDGDRSQGHVEVGPVYKTTVPEVAAMIREFAASRESLVTPGVGVGLTRALYATYVSYLPKESFDYRVPQHADPRGVFVEMLRTRDSGQFSYFTAVPGITRGEHYHHSKTEKFLVLVGTAHFGFRHIETGETHEIVTRGGEARIVETIPGWTHNITNIGADNLVVMLWANEIFDRARPDTIGMKVAT